MRTFLILPFPHDRRGSRPGVNFGGTVPAVQIDASLLSVLPALLLAVNLDQLYENLGFYWWTFWVVERAIAAGTSLHAVLHKRETNTLIGWVSLIWLSPVFGSLLYYCFGVNRIERRGRRLQKWMDHTFTEALIRGRFIDESTDVDLPFNGKLASVVAHVTGKPLLTGNAVQPLVGGEEAYPSMLAAIAQAHHSVNLCTYIFDNDRAGAEFVEALCQARDRGVQVRVLIDSVGARYSHPSIAKVLKSHKINVHTFLPTLGPRMVHYANLRNHRKVMIVDGRVGFTGGMNIRAGCRSDWPSKHPVQDIHFRLEGPVVSHLQEVFVTDWAFACDEKLHADVWFAPPEKHGDIRARGISHGPDNDLDHIRAVMMGAISIAEKRIDVVTPYFLPDEALIAALCIADMRGVRVRILLPEVNNIRMVQWASSDPVRHLLERGCEIYRTPPPFDHSKIFLIDDDWSLIGSSNWDPRSLRLNFEFNVECYGQELNAALSEIVEQKILVSRRMSQMELLGRTLPVKLRDGLARMAIPYL